MKLRETTLLLLVFWFSACTQVEDKVPLAQVGTKYLYLEDVQKVLPDNISDTDSTLWMEDFIHKWVQKELLILNAEKNLTQEQKDVSHELQEYRNSLLTYRYKKALMEQKMDTTIHDDEISQYYEANKKEFVLQSDIVKAIYLKIPLEVANEETIKNLCFENDPQKLQELDEYGIRYAKSYDRFDDKWIDASQVLAQIPGEIDDLERFLRRNKFIESDDTDYYYFICIRDFRFEGEYAPIDFVSSSIKNILLNQRKINFLKKIETDVYKEGLESNKFKLYNTQN
ncbi:hypothetical protein [Sunxiuqinia elliptica]|uniref:Peptidyl-prolyl cis-trans isomerase n=1 Tax=Sunxiuqinia elliptica TaxID=655355 RepID=A0A1I2H625_9BACT|nr:hypothetical protein [Sunxiuqinia elliptica]SFF24091.1 hypothetical protein SAMN05216283_103242 [Sunxiuqinia elliptica]